MDKDFLLNTATARHLYHDVAEGLPIIDYHCHLSPREIAEDKKYRSITELWLGGDHYKWRAMRGNGVDEHYITGDASDWEKFEKWAETVPYTLRNPLYHWTHLELSTAFGIDEPLNPDSARRIYDRCNELLVTPEYSARGLMRKYGVECVCTTDDPVDDLHWHRAIKEDGFEVKVLPAWRPDKAMAIDKPGYLDYIKRLEEAVGMEITSYGAWRQAMQHRHDFFAENGCRIADHGVDCMPYAPCSEVEKEHLFGRVLDGDHLTDSEQQQLRSAMLLDLCRMNHAAGWAQQFHFGPLRNVNERMYRALGPDTGFDTINDVPQAEAVAHTLNALARNGKLAKTILYPINPADYVWAGAMLGNFQDGSVPGKIQLGSGWWFNDQLQGMEAQIDALSTQGLLSRFVGMLTDSRSFLSYPRHEYFRRLLCRILGRDIEEGLIPASELPRVEGMVADISYNNAKRYFGI